MKPICIILATFFYAGIMIDVVAQPVFRFSKDDYDFGVVEEGEYLTFSFEFTNAGSDTIHLKEETRDVRPGCSCTASEYTRTPVAPGEIGFVKAGYQTTGRIGSFQKNITISQKGKPCKILTIKGMVVKKIESLPAPKNPKKLPELAINKKDHYFGKIEKGQSSVWKFNISNEGKDTLKISAFYSACKCIGVKLLNSKDYSNLAYILPGKNALLEVNYAPGNPGGLSDAKMQDILTLFTNDPDNRKFTISLSADVVEKSE